MRGALRLLLDLLVERPATCAALLLAILLGFGAALPRLEMDSSATGLIVPTDPATAAYEDVKKTFGDDVVFTIIYRSARLFTPEVLTSIDDVTFALEDLDGVTRVVSLSTVGDLRGEAGDVLNTSLLMSHPPETQAEADLIREHALANVLLVGEVVGRDGRAAALSAFVEARPDDREFERRTLNAIEAILAKERERLGDGVEIYVSGGPIVKVAIVDNLFADARLLAPISMLAVGAVLLLFFRAFVVVVLPVVTGAASVVATLGFMAMLGYDLNPLSIIIPSLLMVVGSTEDIHILSEYAAALGQGKDKHTAMRSMLRVSGLAIVLTSLTTTIGFLTLVPHEIPIISEFGIAASFGMAINFVITVLAAALVTRLMPVPRQFERADPAWMGRMKGMLAHIVLVHRRWVMVGCVAFCAASVWAASLVVVNNDYLAFFSEGSPIRQRLAEQARDVSGASLLLVEVDTHRTGGLQNPETLAEIARLTDFLAGRHDDVLSYDMFVRKTHMEVNGGTPADFTVPPDQNLIAQYSLLIAPETLARFADFRLSRALILVRTRLGGSDQMMKELPILEAFAKRELSPSLSVSFTGESVLVARSADRMSREIVLNLGYVFLAIFVLLSLLFMSVRAGLLSLVPNLVPILGVFGAMGLLGIPLGTAVFPVAVIALGIAVDDTIHFMTRYSMELRSHDSNETAIRRAIDQEFRPILSSSAALMAGFLVLTTANFGSIQQFGLLSVIAMGLALVADLLITPALLVTTPIASTWDLIRVRLDPGFEAESALLRGLKRGEIRRVAASALVRRFAPGERLIEQGAAGRDMFLILSGSIDVFADRAAGAERLIGEAGRGNVVGELAFLTGAPRTADVVARDAVEALQISAVTLDRVRRRYPKVAAKLFYNIGVILTERLTEAEQLTPGRAGALGGGAHA